MNPRPVTLLDVLGAAQSGQVALAPESAGYLALSLADALATAPRCPEATEVLLSDGGRVDVLARTPTSDRAAEAAGRALLAQLLRVAGSQAPALAAAAKKTAAVGVSALVRDLEAALIPVNRAAATRALARLHRETSRVRGDASEVPYSPPVAPPMEATPTDLDPVLAFVEEPLDQEVSIVIGEITIPVETTFDPSIPLARRAREDEATRARVSSPQAAVAADGHALPVPTSLPRSPSSPPALQVDRGWEPRAPRTRSRAGTYALAVTVVLGLLAILWIYTQYPAFFTGHR